MIAGTSSKVGTSHAKEAEKLITNSIEEYLKENLKISLMFEWVGPNNLHVVKYDKEELVLIGARNKKTGERLRREQLDEIAKIIKVNRPKFYIMKKEDLLNFVETDENEEGFVLENKYGHLLKLKTINYVNKHRTTNILFKAKVEGVLTAFTEGILDDHLPHLDEDKKKIVEEILREYKERVKKAYETEKLLETMTRKEFFLSEETDMGTKQAAVAKDKETAIVKQMIKEQKREEKGRF